jgi:hypothetical protein
MTWLPLVHWSLPSSFASILVGAMSLVKRDIQVTQRHKASPVAIDIAITLPVILLVWPL